MVWRCDRGRYNMPPRIHRQRSTASSDVRTAPDGVTEALVRQGSLAGTHMIVERIGRIEDFHHLRTEWDDVYDSDPEAHFFLSWQWLAGALDSYPGEWMVLVARGVDGRCLGMLPLQVKTVWSQSRQRVRNELHFAGRLFWADYGGVLCLPDHEAEVLSALASQLKEMNWSQLVLKGFRISDRRFHIFMEALADDRLEVESMTSVINNGETDNLVCPYVELPDTFETYLSERLSSNTRQKTRRLLRKLEAASEYTITTSSAATRSRDVRILETLWQNMWHPLKGSDTPRLAAQYARIVTRGLEDDLVHLSVLWYGDAPVGVLASFIDWKKSRLLFFLGARDEAFRDVPVGLVLHMHNIRWAIEHNIKTYDLLRGNEPYKYSLGAVDVRLKYPVIGTESGINLNGALDPSSVGEAVHLAQDLFTQNRTLEAMTSCHQVLTTAPGHEQAKTLLRGVVDAVLGATP